MDGVIIFLVITCVLLPLKGLILYVVFREDIRQWWQGRKAPAVPACQYCKSRWTRPVDEGQTRWEDDALVLVTTYECQHCHFPFWHVERVPVGTLKR